jgi:L-2-hydroxyglutarate oxidase
VTRLESSIAVGSSVARDPGSGSGPVGDSVARVSVARVSSVARGSVARVSSVAVVGGGIVGLAVARQLLIERPGVTLDLFEKESAVATHQTGHNSGVLHAGLYYASGSLKAQLCQRGGSMLREYAAEHAIALHELGKVVVARSSGELLALQRIAERAEANAVPGFARLGPSALADIEPHVTGVAALHSPHTAVVDFAAVARVIAAEVTALGGRVHLGSCVTSVQPVRGGVEVATGSGQSGAGSSHPATGSEHSSAGSPHPATGSERRRYRTVVLCAGLGTDALSRSSTLRILPFRGHYHALAPDARALVRGLVYPVPDPRYPFLGIHLTRQGNGEVLVGPNALAALAPEGYHWSDVDVAALARWSVWPGSWALARHHWRTGVGELLTSLSRRAFAAAARSYVPAIAEADLMPAPAGVPAQAVDRRGQLVDDFAIDVTDGLVVVRNAPSPAATSSMAIAEHIASRVP